jgi:hypothetical protein
MNTKREQVGYEAYAESTGGKTFDGRPIPPWEEAIAQRPHVGAAWRAAADAIAATVEEDPAIVLARRVLRSTTSEIKGGLNFGEALFALRTGHRVARAGWNGKKMWIALTPGTFIAKELARAGAAQHLRNELEAARAADPHLTNSPMRICPHIDMRAADGSLVIGWLASQTDMLAEDWCVVEDAADHGSVTPPRSGRNGFCGFFTCPQCGGHEWGTEIAVEGDVGHCHGYVGTQRCAFTWNRKDDATYLTPAPGAQTEGIGAVVDTGGLRALPEPTRDSDYSSIPARPEPTTP